MITVKLFGLLRIDSGMKEVKLDASTVSGALQALEEQGLPKKALNGCAILINGKPARKRDRLSPDDTIFLIPPVAGG